ncbi:MAG: transcription elongation factor GreA [Clostridia bacterium]|nr:transcription elongation factor GreA [Clostridia bacterium]
MEGKMDKVILTPEGKKQLEDRLTELKTVKRAEVSKKIGIAREFGDLSENAEYDAAKEEQGMIESEIAEIEEKLRNCEIIDKSNLNTKVVSVGSIVKVYDVTFDEEIEYQIIGSTESDPFKGLISNESPVGRALIGKKKGETVVVKTNTGNVEYKILDIRVK